MKTSGQMLLRKIKNYNSTFSRISEDALLANLCFAESYEIFADIANLFLSNSEVSQELADAVEDFKQFQYESFKKIHTAKTISKNGQSNKLNFLVAFLYFYFFDLRYGGFSEWNRAKYKLALKTYLKESQNNKLHKNDKDTVLDFNTKHLTKISEGLSA